jgi:hypothetical protein
MAKDQLPSLSQPKLEIVDSKPAETEIFRVLVRKGNRGTISPVGRSGKSEYEFNTLPRRIHGVWKGVPLNECVGGNCESIKSLTPERWATVALEDTQVFNIERDGSYLGFVQYVPLKAKDGIYASVDFGAPILRNKILVRDPDGNPITRTFYEVWLESAVKHKPNEWSGFIVGESDAINNAGVLGEVRESASFLAGRYLGKPTETLQHIDPMASKIVAIAPKSEHAAMYGGNMIADALVPDARAVTVLNSEAIKSENDFRRNPKKFRDFLENASFEEKMLWLSVAKERASSDPLAKTYRDFLNANDVDHLGQFHYLNGLIARYPDKLMPTAKEFGRISELWQLTILGLIGSKDELKKLSKQERELLKVASLSNEGAVRVVALGLREARSFSKPSKKELQEADHILSAELRSDPDSKIIWNESLKKELWEKKYPKSQQEFLNLAEKNKPYWRELTNGLHRAVSDARTDEAFIKKVFALMDSNVELRKYFIKRLGWDLIKPDALQNPTAVRRLGELAQSQPQLFDELGRAAIGEDQLKKESITNAMETLRSQKPPLLESLNNRRVEILARIRKKLATLGVCEVAP